jgi:hypothetical protein
MISQREVMTALYGVWRLAHFDKDGWRALDHSIDGIWKSFFAAVLVAPAQAVMIMMSLSASEAVPTAGPLRMIAVFSISYVIGWVAFPLIMAAVSETFGKGANFGRYIVGYNWAQVVQVGVFFPAAVISTAFGPGGAASLISLAALLAVLTYAWFVARTGLDIPAVGAVAVVVLDIVLSIVLNSVGRLMIGSI